MNKLRSQYIYQFPGKILTKRLAQASPTSKYAGQPYYVLAILQKDHTKKSIQVFKDKLASKPIWTSIEQGNCLGRQYLLLCRNQRGYFYLVDWKELGKAEDKPASNNKKCQTQYPNCLKKGEFQHILKLGAVPVSKQWVCGNCKQVLENSHEK